MRPVGGLRLDRRGIVVAAAGLAVALVLVLLVALSRAQDGGGTAGSPVRAPTGAPADPAVVAQALSESSFGTHEGGPLVGLKLAYEQRTGASRKDWPWPLGHALNIWGEAMLKAEAAGPVDAVVRLQRPSLYFEDTSGRWTKVAEPRPDVTTLWTSTVSFPDGQWTQGAPFPWAYDEASDTWTFDAGQFPQGTHAHWGWNSYYPRVMVPDDVQAVATAGYARLEGPDADSGNWLLGLSSDTFTGPDDTGTQSNVSLEGPRYRAASSAWQLFGVTTQTAEELRDNPPPVPAAPAS
jgi:hypothetical protein